ncbi:DNA/RNA non-specific endonuclease [Haloglycomyces albus]|uniref:DNA/RNA non-specific endonuclease n=1 Tax=Haloglycomyces albus TaxID=526067 RepID=UPI00146FBAF8|nr:DNA/RNA non-specific endonuclease [Haloglycomyces albus]
MNFSNPAPTPRPGETTRVTINYSAFIYSPTVHGASEEKYRKLAKRLDNPIDRAKLDTALENVSDGFKSTVIGSVSHMLDENVDPTGAVRATDSAVDIDVGDNDFSPLPQQQRLAEAGDRFNGWSTIASHQNNTFADDYPIYQEALDTVLTELANPAQPTVTLTTTTDSDRQITAARVLSDRENPKDSKCYLIVGDGGKDLNTVVDDAMTVLSAKPDSRFGKSLNNDCRSVVTIVAGKNDTALQPERIAPDAQSDRKTLTQRLRKNRDKSTACRGTGPKPSRLRIQNRTGDFEWTSEELCAATVPTTPQQDLDQLNSADIDQSVWEDLKKENIVVVNDAGKVEEIKFSKEGNCKTVRSYGNTDRRREGSDDSRKGGTIASGAAAHLCAPVPEGEPAKRYKPWDWPKNNEVTEKGQYTYARCHLLGKQLSGYGKLDNLVTCLHEPTNNTAMRPFETDVKRLINEGAEALYVSVPVFRGETQDDSRHPPLYGIRVLVIYKGGGMQDYCFRNIYEAYSGFPGSYC